jgi:hypothetical protein
MKVLFAVSNEEISEAIVKRYQKQYKEIISYKNVYYFNAILKEIQKDKTYDRIVISEELEAFTSTQYEQIDRFIFDKLDSISDEAANTRGDNTPIILICSDRRSKGEEMLVKLFGIGIYDALIGNDRGVEEVCNLIHKSRSKKEAKLYYKIEADEVKYQSENENDVSEQEIQNILAHYKRLGKNEDKYVTSFDNIVAQYNDAQLRIISKFLPLNVRAVLEEKSPKYQQIMSFNNAVTDSIRKPKKPQSLGPSGKLLRPKNKAVMPTEPIVIPNAVDTENVKKLTRNRTEKVDNGIKGIEETATDFEDFSNNNLGNDFEENKTSYDPFAPNDMQNQEAYDPFTQNNTPNQEAYDPFAQSSMQNQGAYDPFAQSNMQFDNFSNFNTGITNDEQNNISEEPKRRGRKPKNVEEIEEPVQVQVPKRRGRPRKNPVVEQEEDDSILPGFETPSTNYQEQENDDELLPGFETINKDDNIVSGFEDNDKNDNILPGFEEVNTNNNTLSDFEEDDNNVLPGFEEEDTNNNTLPGFENTNAENEINNNPFSDIEPENSNDAGFSGFEDFNTNNNQFNNNQFNNQFGGNQFDNNQFNNNQFGGNQFDNNQFSNNQFGNNQINYNQPSSYDAQVGDLSRLLTDNKKIATFVGTSKNGTSFIVNNLAEYASSMGINVAILDTTKNKNSYYIYTKNEEELRQIAGKCLENLTNGLAKGISVNRNLTVYTSLPEDREELENVNTILETLVRVHDLILIDCDFDTPYGYFASAQEIYLVQSYDILTIQPLTAFMRELKAQNILDQSKLKILLNKHVRVRGISEKTIVGGMSKYNDPAMSFMTDLFDVNAVKFMTIQFEQDIYTRYLESVINCDVSIKGYSKTFTQTLKELCNWVYQNSMGNNSYRPQSNSYNNGTFSANMNDTLNQMRRKY